MSKANVGDNKSAFYCLTNGEICRIETFYNNGRRYDAKIGDILEVTDKCRDEGWKTVSAFPEKYPFLNPGDKGEVIEIFSNYYGTYIKFKVENGIFDIDPKNLFYPSNE